MGQFLLVYRRPTGELLELEELGSDRAAALRRRAECERLQKDNPEVEVVVLNARSREALMQTHARYFKRMGQLAGDLRDRLPK